MAHKALWDEAALTTPSCDSCSLCSAHRTTVRSTTSVETIDAARTSALRLPSRSRSVSLTVRLCLCTSSHSCGAAKPSGSTGSHPRHHRTPSISPTQTFSSLPGTYASIHAPVNAGMHGRTVSGPAAPPSHMQQQRGLATSASNPDFFGTGTGRGLPFPSGQVFGAGPAGGSLGLTGLGGDAAGNGRTRSISYAGGGMSGLGRAAAQPGMIPVSFVSCMRLINSRLTYDFRASDPEHREPGGHGRPAGRLGVRRLVRFPAFVRPPRRMLTSGWLSLQWFRELATTNLLPALLPSRFGERVERSLPRAVSRPPCTYVGHPSLTPLESLIFSGPLSWPPNSPLCLRSPRSRHRPSTLPCRPSPTEGPLQASTEATRRPARPTPTSTSASDPPLPRPTAEPVDRRSSRPDRTGRLCRLRPGRPTSSDPAPSRQTSSVTSSTPERRTVRSRPRLKPSSSSSDRGSRPCPPRTEAPRDRLARGPLCITASRKGRKGLGRASRSRQYILFLVSLTHSSRPSSFLLASILPPHDLLSSSIDPASRLLYNLVFISFTSTSSSTASVSTPFVPPRSLAYACLPSSLFSPSLSCLSLSSPLSHILVISVFVSLYIGSVC